MSQRTLAAFFSTASQYYISGRYAVLAGLVPVAGNLLHHAVEMYIKGALSRSLTLAELRPVGHDLNDAWRRLKNQAADAQLQRYDSVVCSLHRFETLRYPESVLTRGMIAEVGVKRPRLRGHLAGQREPRYALWLEDVDALVGAVFTTASAHPAFFFAGLSRQAKTYLGEANAQAWAS